MELIDNTSPLLGENPKGAFKSGMDSGPFGPERTRLVT